MIKNKALAHFPSWAANAAAQAVSGDFNGDGRYDIALTGPTGWGSVPVALSVGNGRFEVVNEALADFPSWASWDNATAIAGDFNGDHLDDLLLLGSPGFHSVPIAVSAGDGTFIVSNPTNSTIAQWAAQPGVVPVSGVRSQ